MGITKGLLDLVTYKMQQVGKGPVYYELEHIRNDLEKIIMKLDQIQNYERMPEHVYALHDDGKIQKLTKTELYILSGEKMTVQEFLGGRR